MSEKLQALGLTFAALYAAAYAAQSARVSLKYFSATEFGIWWPLLNPDLLLALDEFRERLGVPVVISPAEGAIGRLSGREGSQHLPRPMVNAIDVMPVGVSLERAYQVAREVGFTGIGLYPDWQPRPGIHLDMRPGRKPENPALWSMRLVGGNQKMFSIERGFV